MSKSEGPTSLLNNLFIYKEESHAQKSKTLKKEEVNKKQLYASINHNLKRIENRLHSPQKTAINNSLSKCQSPVPSKSSRSRTFNKHSKDLKQISRNILPAKSVSFAKPLEKSPKNDEEIQSYENPFSYNQANRPFDSNKKFTLEVYSIPFISKNKYLCQTEDGTFSYKNIYFFPLSVPAQLSYTSKNSVKEINNSNKNPKRMIAESPRFFQTSQAGNDSHINQKTLQNFVANQTVIKRNRYFTTALTLETPTNLKETESSKIFPSTKMAQHCLSKQLRHTNYATDLEEEERNYRLQPVMESKHYTNHETIYVPNTSKRIALKTESNCQDLCRKPSLILNTGRKLKFVKNKKPRVKFKSSLCGSIFTCLTWKCSDIDNDNEMESRNSLNSESGSDSGNCSDDDGSGNGSEEDDFKSEDVDEIEYSSDGGDNDQSSSASPNLNYQEDIMQQEEHFGTLDIDDVENEENVEMFTNHVPDYYDDYYKYEIEEEERRDWLNENHCYETTSDDAIMSLSTIKESSAYYEAGFF